MLCMWRKQFCYRLSVILYIVQVMMEASVCNNFPSFDGMFRHNRMGMDFNLQKKDMKDGHEIRTWFEECLLAIEITSMHEIFQRDHQGNCRFIAVVDCRASWLAIICIPALNRLTALFVSPIMVTDELKRKIEGLIAQAVDDGKLVSSVRNVLDLLKENHLMWTQTLNPDRVGVHWENRDGVGLSCQQVHLLLDDVAAVGFSHEATSGICFEIPVDEGLRQIAMKFNETLHGSNMLPPMPEGMKYLSVAGSHLNMAMRCLIHNTSHHDPKSKLVSNGKLSLGQLEVVDSRFAEACRTGISWRVIDARVQQEFPTFPKLLQSAMNTTIAKNESELQLLRKITDVVDRRGQDQMTWASIKDDILRSKPILAGTCPFLFTFAMRCGGKGGHLLKSSEAYIKIQGHSTRALGHEIYDALSTETKGAQHIFFRHCMLKLAYCTRSPEKLVTVQEIKKALAGPQAPLRAQVEKTLQQGKEIMKNMSVKASNHVHTTVMGNFEVMLARAGLQRKGVHVYHACEAFLKDVGDLMGTHVDSHSDWESLRLDMESKIENSSKKVGAEGFKKKVLPGTTLLVLRSRINVCFHQPCSQPSKCLWCTTPFSMINHVRSSLFFSTL